MPRAPTHKPICCRYFTWRLFQRAGVWYADGRTADIDLGKHSLGTRDRRLATQELSQLDVQMAIQHGIASAQTVILPEDIIIAEGWALYLANCGRSQGLGGVAPKSLQRYNSIRDKHVPWCSSKDINSWRQFDRKAFEKYGDWMFKNYAYRTCYTDLTQVKSVVKWLIDEKHLPEGSRIVYKLQKPEGSDTYCPRAVEVSAMIDLCLNRPDLRWLGHVLFALAHLGLRISELAALRWTDVDLAQGFVRIADERASSRKTKAGTARTTKGRRSRVIPIHPELAKLLLKMGRRADGRVFQAIKGGILRPDNARAIFIRDVVEALTERFPTPADEIGFAAVRFHSLRHYFCSQCFLGGASEGEIREWMGHRDSKIVELYRHLRREDATRKMRQIAFLDSAGYQITPS
jgi:integrase